MTINFCSDVRLSPVIYREDPNWKQMLWANSNDNNSLIGCPIESHNRSRRSKLKAEACSILKPQYIEKLEIERRNSEQIQTIITFYLDARLRPIIYRDTRNWKQKLWANSNDDNFSFRCLIEFLNILRRLKLKTEPLRKFKPQ